MMRRIITLVVVALDMAAMMLTLTAPAMAEPHGVCSPIPGRTLRPTLLFLVLGIPYYSTALTAAHPANHPFCCCRHNIHPPSGRGILRSSDAGSCIDRPPALRGSPLSAVPPLSGGTTCCGAG